MAGYKQSGRLLECIDGNFQIRAEPIRRGSLLDCIHQKGGAHLECEHQEATLSAEAMVEFRTLKTQRRVRRKLSCLQKSQPWPLQRFAQKSPMGQVNTYGSPHTHTHTQHTHTKKKKAYNRWKQGQVGLGKI